MVPVVLVLLHQRGQDQSCALFLAQAARRSLQRKADPIAAGVHILRRAGTPSRRRSDIGAMEAAARLSGAAPERPPAGPTDRAREDKLLFKRYLETRDPAARDAL